MTSTIASAGEPQDSRWHRVTRRNRCPICEHDSWCTVAPDRSAARCKRVASDHPCPGEDGDAWLHVIHELRPARRANPLPMLPPLRRDLERLADDYRTNATPTWIERNAEGLGVAREALVALGVGRDPSGNLAFPMVNAAHQVVGIRIRTPQGQKFAVRGGHEGVFLPRRAATTDGILLFPEGPTCSAAVLTLGFEAVGRPSCSGGVRYCTELARLRECVVVADADAPGQRGAMTLVTSLVAVAKSVRILTPPMKDMRDWLKAGATHADVADLIAACQARQLVVRYLP